MTRQSDPNPVKDQQNNSDQAKPGSDPQSLRDVGGKGDFGVPANRRGERDYASANTKAADRGASQPGAAERDGVRDHGAGGRSSGPGSASGGDLDPDIVGVGTGGSGVAASGDIGRRPGPDDSDGTSDEFASGGHAQGRNQRDVGKVGGSKRVHGTVVSGGDDRSTTPSGQGADAATNPARDDDSFAGEISSGEAAGEDNEMGREEPRGS